MRRARGSASGTGRAARAPGAGCTRAARPPRAPPGARLPCLSSRRSAPSARTEPCRPRRRAARREAPARMS
eukprot:scaffold1112_cov116-Isochrysis_galbana.AAC.7